MECTPLANSMYDFNHARVAAMKRNTIRSALFLTYSIIICISFLAVALFFSLTEAPKLKAQTLASLKQSGENITASMDSEFSQMKIVALNIAYSNLVKSRFIGYISSKNNNYENLENTKVLGDLLTAIIGPNRPVDQVNLYAPNNSVIASGLLNGQFSSSASDQPWYDKVLKDINHKAIVYYGTDQQLKRYFTNPQSQQFVSFAMQFFDIFNYPQGFVETKKNVRQVFSAAYVYKSVYGEQVYIFDGNDGSIVFPQDKRPSDEVLSFVANSNAGITKMSESKNQEYLIYSKSAFSNFRTVIVISQAKLLQPVYSYTRNIILITICALIFALVLAYFAAQYITKPIGEIYNEVIHFDIATPYVKKNVQTNIIELKTLSDSFSDMQEKLIESINKQFMLQNQEMQSHMLALQSQMNPHFLYNSIAAIQSMAEEGMDREIAIMCLSMANILRYISSDTKQEVILEDEIHYTHDYLSCMMIRYQGDLSYTIDIPEQMNKIKVPKLCVQLLVENAIKFTSTKRPPYHVSITGKIHDKQYELSIKDNGPGFSEEALHDIREKITDIDRTGLLPSLEINGMGLLNVYIRFKLLHGVDIIFKVENNETGGACVTIGGAYE